jgi:hypothetical protein
MATTTKAPPKSFRGRSARELMSAEAADGGPPVTVFGTNTRGPITLRAGLPLIIDAPVEEPVRHVEGDTDPLSINVAGYKKIRFQCDVLASSVPEGTRLALRLLRFNGADWVYFTEATSGPFIPIHEVNTESSTGRIIPVGSAWFVMDDANDIDNITIEWVTYGGDGTGEVTIGNIYIELTSDPRPPNTQIPPDPQAPSDLYAYWPMFAGNTAESGVSDADQYIPNYAGNGITADLIRGEDKFEGAWDGEIVPAVTRQLFKSFGSGGGGVNHDYMWLDGVPSLATGCSIVFYGVMAALGTAVKHICGVRTPAGLGTNDHYLHVDPTSRLLSATVTEAAVSPSLPVDRTATGTTQILDLSQHLYCLAHDGTTLRVGLDGVFEGSVACSTADISGTNRYLVLASGGKSSTAQSGPDVFSLGDIWFYTRAITEAEFAEIWAVVKVQHNIFP